MRKLRAFTPTDEFFLHLALDLIHVVVQIGDGAIALHQFKRRFFAHAGHAGDIVGMITHQGLHFNDALRRKPFFGKHFRRITDHVGDAFFGMQNGGFVRNQLQNVLIAADDHGGHITTHSKRADDVVRLKPGKFHHGDAHRKQKLLHCGDLRLEFLRHRMTLCLVSVVFQMTESGLMHVKRRHNVGGVFAFDQL